MTPHDWSVLSLIALGIGAVLIGISAFTRPVLNCELRLALTSAAFIFVVVSRLLMQVNGVAL